MSRNSSNQHLLVDKVIPGEKIYVETVSSSMISVNQTFKESGVPPNDVLIFGNNIVNFNSKINIT